MTEQRPEFDAFFKIETSKINFSIQDHHPFYHYDGANECCPKCNPRLESPQQLYDRIYPIAICGDEEVEVEVVEEPMEDAPMIEIEESPAKKGIFAISNVFRTAQEKRIEKKLKNKQE